LVERTDSSSGGVTELRFIMLALLNELFILLLG
jgi:hypothetical protein